MTALSDDLIDIARGAASGGYHLFLGQASSTVILAVASMLIARLLGPADYGVYSIAFVAPSILLGIVAFAIPTALTRFAASLRSSGRRAELFSVTSTGFYFELGVSLVASAVCYLFADFFAAYMLNRPEVSAFLRTIALLIVLQMVFDVFAAIFVGLDAMHASALMNVVRAIVKISLSPALILLGFGVHGALSAHLICYVIGIMVGLVFLRKSSLVLRFTIDPRSLTTLFRFASPIYGASLIQLLSQQYQTIVMSYFATDAQIGNFQVITLFSRAILILSLPLMSLFPSFTRVQANLEQLRSIFRRSAKYSGMIIVPAALLISVLSNELVHLFFGSAYTLAPRFLSLFILVYLNSGVGTAILIYLFNGTGRTDIVLRVTLIRLGVYLPLAPAFTSLFGLDGLIAATLVATLTRVVADLFYAKRAFDILPDFRAALRIYLAALLSVVPPALFALTTAYPSEVTLIASALLFLATYLIILPLVRVINDTDLAILSTIFTRNRTLRLILEPLLKVERRLIALFTRR